MKRSFILGAAAALAAIVLVWTGDAFGRGGLGGVGGGGGRGGGGGGGAHGRRRRNVPPQRWHVATQWRNVPSQRRHGTQPQPAFDGQCFPSERRCLASQFAHAPGGGNVAGGGFSPSGGRPSTRPSTPNRFPTAGTGQRPSISHPGDLRPATRPSLPGAGGGGTQRPGAGIGDIGRPGAPGGIGRPGGDIGRPGGIGGIGGPGAINRPSIGGIGGPGGIGGIGDVGRPGGIGGIGDAGRPGRPVIGGGNNRPGNINIGNDINIGNNVGNRPGWGLDPGYGNNWGNNWHNNWHDHCIHDHYHGWYNGCWNGHWNNNWWAPVGWATVGWGLSNWGYSEPYYNPYYVESAAPAYDYSQPVVVNNYVSSDADAAGGTAAATQQESPENQQAMKLFDEGMAAFKAGNYPQALTKYEAALKLLPNDPVLHEVRALTLFALGKYKEAAAGLNSLLASSPGMDWTSMSSLYGNADDYTLQLRKLEAHIKADRTDAPAIFLLAYHYLVLGQQEEAVKRSARSSASNQRMRRRSGCSLRWPLRKRSRWRPRRRQPMRPRPTWWAPGGPPRGTRSSS